MDNEVVISKMSSIAMLRAREVRMELPPMFKTRLLSVEELSQLLGISPRTIYNGVHRRAKKPFPIKPKRIGRSIKFDVRDVERFIESL